MRFSSLKLALWSALAFADLASAGQARVEHLGLAVEQGRTTLQIALDEAARYRVFSLEEPARAVIDIQGARLARSVLPLPAGAGSVLQIKAANRADGSVRIVLELNNPVALQGLESAGDGRSSANHISVSIAPALRAEQPAAVTTPMLATNPEPAATVPASRVPEPAPAPASPAATGSREDNHAAAPDGVASRLPLPIDARDIVVAIDAGHGGKDPGAHGPRGVQEKDVTLQLARRLAEIVNAEPGMRAVLTRTRDEFVPLRGRMERARAARADLFVSIHADAVRNRAVRGASVYVLNEKGATDEAARRLAARENAADLVGGVRLRDKDRTLASVLLDLSQNAALGSSVEVGDAILDEIARVGTVRKPQVMQAPFMVLKSPDVPSVLIETAYISNPEEERRLDSHAFRDRLARAVFAGVKRYFYENPPRGTLVAELSRRRTRPVSDPG